MSQQKVTRSRTRSSIALPYLLSRFRLVLLSYAHHFRSVFPPLSVSFYSLQFTSHSFATHGLAAKHAPRTSTLSTRLHAMINWNLTFLLAVSAFVSSTSGVGTGNALTAASLEVRPTRRSPRLRFATLSFLTLTAHAAPSRPPQSFLPAATPSQTSPPVKSCCTRCVTRGGACAHRPRTRTDPESDTFVRQPAGNHIFPTRTNAGTPINIAAHGKGAPWLRFEFGNKNKCLSSAWGGQFDNVRWTGFYSPSECRLRLSIGCCGHSPLSRMFARWVRADRDPPLGRRRSGGLPFLSARPSATSSAEQKCSTKAANAPCWGTMVSPSQRAPVRT